MKYCINFIVPDTNSVPDAVRELVRSFPDELVEILRSLHDDQTSSLTMADFTISGLRGSRFGEEKFLDNSLVMFLETPRFGNLWDDVIAYRLFTWFDLATDRLGLPRVSFTARTQGATRTPASA